MRAAIAALSVFLFVAPAMSRNYCAGFDPHVLVGRYATLRMMHSSEQ